ncbi:hypothetical protein [Sphingopyxis sp.]|uniref:hypothetical protein n=1 Tax=Sphingopyxis sp. TaxID=1908224 RepID=UPI002D76E66A|nr:hypothetical protein [Sphingopyxis sp.]
MDTARGPRKGNRASAPYRHERLRRAIFSKRRARFTEIAEQFRALKFRQIERELAAYEPDAGETYIDFEPPAHALSVPLNTAHSPFLPTNRRHGKMGLIYAG